VREREKERGRGCAREKAGRREGEGNVCVREKE